MAYEKKDMSGTLFKNDKREKDTHPNATGTAIINGVEYWVSAWTKDGAKGKFQSLAFKPKEERAQEIRKTADVNRRDPSRDRDSYGNEHDDPDDLPF
jgi:hypothetical protein